MPGGVADVLFGTCAVVLSRLAESVWAMEMAGGLIGLHCCCVADRTTGASESLGGCRECLVGWQMCFLAHVQWCFLDWQRVFGQWKWLVDSLVCIVVVWLTGLLELLSFLAAGSAW